MKTVENGKLRMSIKEMGAELCELYDLEKGCSVLWSGDAKWWAGTSPLLFPNCGLLKNNTFTYGGKTYTQPNHGFAKASEFALVNADESSLTYRLRDTPESRENYPFAFDLEVRHTLEGRTLRVEWRVLNTGDSVLPFSIGGHSAFMTRPTAEGEGHAGCYLVFDKAGDKSYQQKTSAGPLSKEIKTLPTDNSRVKLTADFFAGDLLLFEGQTKSLALADEKGNEFVKVNFEGFPVVVAWAKPNAPFVCIEPWFGKPDDEDFEGNILERKHIIALEPGKVWRAAYTVECL